MYIFGKNVAKEALKNNKKINKAYISKDFSDKNIISLLQKENISIEYVTKFELDKIEKGNHQGIILSVPEFKYCDLDDLLTNPKPFLVILDHIEDPHNFGAIIRTCVAAGVDGIVIPRDRSVSVNSTVMKTSVGSALNMKIAMVTNINHAIKYLKDHNYWVYASDMNGDLYTNVKYDGNIAIIIGNEGKGVSELALKSSDYVVSIPMSEKIESLNASVSAGILIYEAVRQRS